MDLASFSLRRPVSAIVLSLLILLAGMSAYPLLGVREYPAIDPPVITIKTNYTGANSELIENQITEPLEKALSGIQGLRTLSSQSSLGSSQITAEFNLGTDLEAAAADVRDKVAGAQKSLPRDLDAPPLITKADANSDNLMIAILGSKDRSPIELSSYIEDHLLDRFQTIPGVSEVKILGERKKALRIEIDPLKLSALGLSLTDLSQALAKENVELPAGKMAGNQVELNLRVQRSTRKWEDFQSLVLKNTGGTLIRLGDVAQIRLGAENEESSFKKGGQAQVGFALSPLPGSNVLEIGKEFQKRMQQVQKELPQDLQLELVLDNTRYIQRSVFELSETLILSISLVVVILFLFFRESKSALRPLIDLPVSLVGSLFVMYLCGFSINLLTLLALILATGLVVDDGIVVAENIFRKVEKGMSPSQAAISGTREIFGAVLSTSLTLAAVFVPLVFIPGFVGLLFREFALTLCAAVLISALVSLTLTPLLSSRFISPKAQHSAFYVWSEPFFRSMEDNYRLRLQKFMYKPWKALVILLVCLALILGIKPLLPSELAPLEDRGMLRVNLSTPEGSTFLATQDYVDLITQKTEESVKDKKFVLSLTAPGFGSGSVNSGALRILLNDQGPRPSQQQIADQLNALYKKEGGGKASVIQEQSIAVGNAAKNALPVQFILQHPDFNQLKGDIPRFLELAQKSPVFAFVDVNLKFNKPGLDLEIQRDKAASLGLSPLDVGRQLQLAVGKSRWDYFADQSKLYPVIGQIQWDWQRSPQELLQLPIAGPMGRAIPLSEVVVARENLNPPQLFHWNRLPSATIMASLAPGRSLGEGIAAMQDIQKQLNDENLSSSLGGSARDLAESSQSLGLAFGLALLLVYLILAAQFENFKSPLVIMLTIPMALAGALASLWYFNQSLNLFSQIGMILLIGLVTKNGILLVEFARKLRNRELSAKEAALEAAAARLRPILMTSLATVLGAMPIALGLGSGASSRMGMGIAIVGGMLFSLVLSLFVIPTFDAWMHKNSKSQNFISAGGDHA